MKERTLGKLYNLAAVHDQLAESIAPEGYRDLKCENCGCRKRVGLRGLARYLRAGWPRCCRKTMLLT